MFTFCSTEEREAKLIDGKKIAEEIRGELREQIKEWMKQENQRAPQLTAILVGEDPASHTYVKNKMKVIYCLFFTLFNAKRSSCKQSDVMHVLLGSSISLSINS